MQAVCSDLASDCDSSRQYDNLHMIQGLDDLVIKYYIAII